ncbi:MAG: hypothetical protein ACKPKO_15910, partial [Candidatus Fonsibacter sp.]
MMQIIPDLICILEMWYVLNVIRTDDCCWEGERVFILRLRDAEARCSICVHSPSCGRRRGVEYA